MSINETTEDGQNTIAQHYGVIDKWTASKHEGDHGNTYFKLLLLVKTKSKNDKCGSVSLKAYIGTLLFLQASCA